MDFINCVKLIQCEHYTDLKLNLIIEGSISGQNTSHILNLVIYVINCHLNVYFPPAISSVKL